MKEELEKSIAQCDELRTRLKKSERFDRHLAENDRNLRMYISHLKDLVAYWKEAYSQLNKRITRE